MHKTNYSINRKMNTIVADRAFDAALPLVWQAWTDHQILDQWWAPSPWQAMTKSQDFTPGGKWLYAMAGPNGEKHWSLAQYIEIVPQQYYTQQVCFSDEDGNPVMAMPGCHWRVVFTAQGETTLVTTTLTFETAEALETLVNMGFQGGFAMGHENLDAYLLAQKK